MSNKKRKRKPSQRCGVMATGRFTCACDRPRRHKGDHQATIRVRWEREIRYVF